MYIFFALLVFPRASGRLSGEFSIPETFIYVLECISNDHMRKTKEEAEVTKEKLLEAAMKVFSSKGYTRSTLDDIAREAGVTRGAIYWHFKGGKPDMYTAIANAGMARANDMIEKVIAESKSPLDMLERLMIRMIEYVEEDEDYRALQELFIFKTETDPELNAGMEDKKHAQEESVKFIADLIAQAKKAGQIRKDVDPLNAAIMAFGLVNGIVLHWMIEHTASGAPYFSLKEKARPITKLFLQSIAA